MKSLRHASTLAAAAAVLAGTAMPAFACTAGTESCPAATTAPDVRVGTNLPLAPQPVTEPDVPVGINLPLPPRPVTEPALPGTTSPTRPLHRTLLVQVVRYSWSNAHTAGAVAALDDDRQLTFRESRRLWGHEQTQLVRVTVPAGANRQHVIAQVNAATSARIGDVHAQTTIRTLPARGSVTVAWLLGPGATATSPWGAQHRTNQVFLAHG